MTSEIDISNIEMVKDKVQITFCTSANAEDFLTIVIDKSTAWEIHDFCQAKLSFAAQQKGE